MARLGIETRRYTLEQGSDDSPPVRWLAFEQESGQRARCGEDRALLRHPLEGRIGLLCRNSHQRAGDRDEQEEGEHLLPDAIWVLGVELTLADVATLSPVGRRARSPIGACRARR